MGGGNWQACFWGKSRGKVDEQELKGLSAYEEFTNVLADKRRRLERENEVFLEEARQRLKGIHVDSTLIMRDSADYIGRKPTAADVIGNLAINLKNLNAVQFYSEERTSGGYGWRHTTRYYCFDYILRADMHWLERERRRLEAYAKLRWQGSIFQPSQRELLDVRWIGGRSGWLRHLSKKLFFGGALNSPLTDALNSDMAVRNSPDARIPGGAVGTA